MASSFDIGGDRMPSNHRITADLGYAGSPGSVLVCPSLAELECRLAPRAPGDPTEVTWYAATIPEVPAGRSRNRSVGQAHLTVRAASAPNAVTVAAIAASVEAAAVSFDERATHSPLLDRHPVPDPVAAYWRYRPMTVRRAEAPAWANHLIGVRVSWRQADSLVIRDEGAIRAEVEGLDNWRAVVRHLRPRSAASIGALLHRLGPDSVRLDAKDLAQLDSETVRRIVSECCVVSRRRTVEIVGEVGQYGPDTHRPVLVGAATEGGHAIVQLIANHDVSEDQVGELESLVRLDPTVSVAADACSLASINRHFNRSLVRPWAEVSSGLRRAGRDLQRPFTCSSRDRSITSTDQAVVLVVGSHTNVDQALRCLAQALSPAAVVGRQVDGGLEILGRVDAIGGISTGHHQEVFRLPGVSASDGSRNDVPPDWLVADNRGIGVAGSHHRLSWSAADGRTLSEILTGLGSASTPPAPSGNQLNALVGAGIGG